MSDETSSVVKLLPQNNNNNNVLTSAANVNDDSAAAADKNNVFDDLLDFETKMYHFLDPQNSDGDDDDEGRTTGDVNGSKLSNSSRFLIRDHRESVIINNNNSTKSNQPAPSKWYCVECQRSFAAQFALDQHRRFKHQGYKIHCRYCQHTTTNGYAMFLHVRREHGDVDEEAAAAQRLALAAQRGGPGETGRPGRLLTPRSTNRKAVNARRKRRAAASRYSNRTSASTNNYQRPAGAVKPGPKPSVVAAPKPPAPPLLTPKTENVKVENLVADPLPPLLPDTPYNRRKRNAAAIKLGSVAALQCDRCDKKFAFHSGLRMHMKMVHSGFKFTCQYCGLNFTNGYAIHRHVNIVHNISGSVRNQNTLQPPSAQLQAMLAHAAPTMAPRRFLVDSLAASAAFEKRPIFQTTDFFPRCNKNDDSAADSFPNSVGTNRLIINNGVSNELIMNNGRVANKRNFDAVEDDAEDDVDDDGNSRRKSRQRRKAPPSKKLTSAAAIFENGNDVDDEWSTTPLLNGGCCAETSTSSLSNIMRRFGEFNNNHHPHHLENSPPPLPSAFSDDNPPALRLTGDDDRSGGAGSFGHSPNNTGGCDDDSCTERRSPAAVNGCVSRSTAAAAATDNVLACPLCPYKTRGRETMRQHFYYHLPAQTQQEDRRNGLLSNDFDSHRCPFCPFVCDQQTQLVAHAATHFMNGVRRHLPSASFLNAATATTPPASSSPQHQAQQQQQQQPQPHRPQLRMPAKFACIFCSRKFDDARTLAEHEARHTKMTVGGGGAVNFMQK